MSAFARPHQRLFRLRIIQIDRYRTAAIERPDDWVAPDHLRARPGGWAKPDQKVEVLLEKKWHKARVDRVDDDYFYFIQYDDLGPGWSEWVTADRMRRPGGATR